MNGVLLWLAVAVLCGIGWELRRVNTNLELIAERIQEANMTYEEYCEYYPGECEETF